MIAVKSFVGQAQSVGIKKKRGERKIGGVILAVLNNYL